MDHNPYTPPQASTEVPVPPQDVPRPFSVWLLMVFLMVFALLYVVMTVRFVADISAHWGEIRSAAPVAASMVWRVVLIMIFLAAAHSAYRRRPWSRWLGVALIGVFAAVLIFGADTTHYANDAERAGGRFGRMILPLLLAWWAYVLVFSAKAKRYFSKPPSAAA